MAERKDLLTIMTAREEWEQAAGRALHGKPLEKLVRHTLDGLVRGPLMTVKDNPAIQGAPGQFPFTRSTHTQLDIYQPWDIRQAIFATDPKAANSDILQELNGGASSFQLESGLEFKTLSDLEILLAGVDQQLAGIGLTSSLDACKTTSLLVEYWQKENLDMAQVRANFGFSPVGLAIRFGKDDDWVQDQFRQAVEMAKWASRNAPKVRTLTLNSGYVHEAGGTEALELAWIAAEATENMRILLKSGLSANDAASQMMASLSMDADLHLGIAKLRAARRIWARVMQVFGVDADHCALVTHAHTSCRMLSRRDPWVNCLRASTAAFASVLGGAQIISVVPFTDALGAPVEMARRLARNTQMVLLEECAAGRVIDPAGGSHAHEHMTNQFAHAGWKLFQEIEAEGGLLAAASSGWLGKIISRSQARRKQQIRTRKIAMIGVSEYANLEEKPPEFTKCNQRKADVINSVLAPFRDAEEFETLRDLSDQEPKRPIAFLASLGALPQSAPRAGFARHLLAAGGIASVGGISWTDIDEMIADFTGSGSRLAIICGAYSQYEGEAELLAIKLRAAGARQVWIAGGPSLESGTVIDGQIALGCDAIEVLQGFHACLGVGDD